MYQIGAAFLLQHRVKVHLWLVSGCVESLNPTQENDKSLLLGLQQSFHL